MKKIKFNYIKFSFSPKIKAFLGKFMLQVAVVTFSAVLVLAMILVFDELTGGDFGCDHSGKIKDMGTLYSLKVDATRAREVSIGYSLWTESGLNRDNISLEDAKILRDSKTGFDLDAGELKSTLSEIDSYLKDTDKCVIMNEERKSRISEIRKKVDQIFKDLIDDPDAPNSNNV